MTKSIEKNVIVYNLNGIQIANTLPSKARKLLRDKKAKVKSIKPFEIQMLQITGTAK